MAVDYQVSDSDSDSDERSVVDLGIPTPSGGTRDSLEFIGSGDDEDCSDSEMESDSENDALNIKLRELAELQEKAEEAKREVERLTPAKPPPSSPSGPSPAKSHRKSPSSSTSEAKEEIARLKSKLARLESGGVLSPVSSSTTSSSFLLRKELEDLRARTVRLEAESGGVPSLREDKDKVVAEIRKVNQKMARLAEVGPDDPLPAFSSEVSSVSAKELDRLTKALAATRAAAAVSSTTADASLIELRAQRSKARKELALLDNTELKRKASAKKKILDSADVVLMMDGTGSMVNMIEMAKLKLVEIMRFIESAEAVTTLRFGSIVYRDIEDGALRFQKMPFTTDLETLLPFLTNVPACGGGDEPEDISGALQEVLNMDWQSNTRVLIHIADSPCHNVKYHNFGASRDSHPEGHGTDPLILLEQLVAMKIDYKFGRMNQSTDKMIGEFVKVYAGTAQLFEQLPLESSSAEAFSKTLIKTLSESISHSRSKEADVSKEAKLMYERSKI